VTDLNAQLLAAHDAGDKATLVALYTHAADTAADTDTACFLLTHAYVFALELDHPATSALFNRLHAHNRV